MLSPSGVHVSTRKVKWVLNVVVICALSYSIASDDVAEVRGLRLSGAQVKRSPPKQL